MTTQLSKADRIRKLLHLSNREVAERVGCRVEYVRAVRQRTSPSGDPITPATMQNWIQANTSLVQTYKRNEYKRMKADPERYQRRLARAAQRYVERYHSDPEFRQKQLEFRATYRKRRAEASAS
jgi:hypothetical protein